MSETTTRPPESTETPPPPEYVPQHVLSSDEGLDDPNPPAQESKPEPGERAREGGDRAREGGGQPEAEPAKPERSPEEKRADSEARRIAALTRQRYAEKARADAAEAARADLADRLHRLENNGQPAPSDIEKAVQARAEQIIAQRETQARINDFHDAGRAAYADWPQRCQDLQAMGADHQIAELLVELPNGAAVAGALAEQPEELQRIAGISTERGRTIALTQYAAALANKPAASPPAAKPPLPAPIRPPNAGRTQGEPDPEKGSYADFEKWSSRINWSNR